MRRLLAIAIALVVPSIGVDARAGSLEDDLNAFLSQVTIDEQRERAIQSASEVLSGFRSPQLAFGIDLSVVSTLAQRLPAITYEGVTVMGITAERQLVRVDIAFDKVFDAIAAAGVPIPELVAQLKPRVVGSAVIYLGVTSSATSSADQNVIRLRLLPALHSVRVDRVEVADTTVPNLLVVLINLVNAFSDRISSYLSSLPICDITLPAAPSSTVALPDSLVVRAPDGEPIAVQLRSRSVPVPVSIIAIAWLVDGNTITAIVRLNTKQMDGQSPSSPPTNFEELSTSFTKLLADGGFTGRRPCGPHPQRPRRRRCLH